AKDLLEEIAFAARNSEFVDAKSGVSARLTISAMENLMAAAKLRLIEGNLERTAIRLLDFMSVIPSITGKIELVYEGEQEGADHVAKILIDQAVMSQFETIFPRIGKLEKQGVKTPYTDLIQWFDENQLQLNYSDTDTDYNGKLNAVKPLVRLVDENTGDLNDTERNFCMELVLWALTVNKKLDKSEAENSFTYDAPGIGKYYSR